ncbi:hypothetical protein [Streptosporangium sp. KLBMP 9127]|nr:hypothetical protein [Streptosporangium sp. KLBMP 9127]
MRTRTYTVAGSTCDHRVAAVDTAAGRALLPGCRGGAPAWEHHRVHVGWPPVRAMRAVVFAVACVAVSATLHGLAGGGRVQLGVLMGATALTWAGAFALGARQRGRGALLVACFTSQYGMHHLFSAGAVPEPSSLAGHLSHQHGGGLGMLLVHGLAAVGSAWWLERGESALASLLHLAVTLMHRLIVRLLAPLIVTERPVPIIRRTDAAPLTSTLLAAVVSRRGPPALPSVL